MNPGSTQAKDLCPELDDRRFLARLDAISMDFAEKHKLEWNNLKLSERLDKLGTENRQAKLELLETKRSLLEAVKQVNLLRRQLEAHVGKTGSRAHAPGRESKPESALIRRNANNLNLDQNLRLARGVKAKQPKRRKEAQQDAKERQVERMESEIDFEVNKLLKNEIVELKLELERLQREKRSLSEAQSKRVQEAVRDKQRLEQINIDINKGRASNARVLLAEKRVRAQRRHRPPGAARPQRPRRDARGRGRRVQRRPAKR